MENYLAAFKERAIDTHELRKANRYIGCIHNGGITIECLLKAIIVKQTGVTVWKRRNDPSPGGIKNPEHDLINAISLVPVLRRRLSATPGMEDNIKLIQRPVVNYIFMRYENNGRMPANRYSDWLVAYNKVLLWLHAQKLH